MGSFGPLHWIVVAIIAVLVLGGGRFSNLMGDVAKGVKNFKKGMAEEDEEPRREPSRIEAHRSAEPAFDRDGEKLREPRDDR
jgi:sec-independent protein translocase protein TatA